jgi:hypothetical protein
MKTLTVIFAIMMYLSYNVKGAENDVSINQKTKPFVDVCDFFMDSRPLVIYDNMFGEEINSASFFMPDSRLPCMNYEYTFNENGLVIRKKINLVYSQIEVNRFYEYNQNGRISKIVEKREDFEKSLLFTYNFKGGICEITEILSPDKLIESGYNFDYLKYEIDNKGHISEVIGVKGKWLGLAKSSTIIKMYDYDEKNRLKSIRDFITPSNCKIIRYDEYVKKN